jgi:hypothetical protein
MLYRFTRWWSCTHFNARQLDHFTPSDRASMFGRFLLRISSSGSFVVVALLAFPTAKRPVSFFLDKVVHTSPGIRASHLVRVFAFLRALLDRNGCGVTHRTWDTVLPLPRTY